MKEKILSILILVIVAVSSTQVVLAGSAKENFLAGQNDAANKMGYEAPKSIPVIIGGAIKIILTLLGIVFLVLMIYGGFKWMKASGREADVEAAKKIIENAMIGLIIVISAYALTAYIGSTFISQVVST